MSSYYVPIGTAPAPDAPTSLVISSPSAGHLLVTLTQPTSVLVRASYVEVTMAAGPDFAQSVVLPIPVGETENAIENYPGLVTAYARAFSVDMFGTKSAYTGTVSVVTVPGVGSGLVLVPLTTETAGVPDFVWDDDNQLVMAEVPA